MRILSIRLAELLQAGDHVLTDQGNKTLASVDVSESAVVLVFEESAGSITSRPSDYVLMQTEVTL